ncbi:MAG TPA: SUMF1/EgtB/PvdO family nonheme iron enzyme [Polyangia bacterium]|jgi:serine/threonine-protein kinase|nr:SUMF1/EgtB/PvdO family nonheme iron enzyme [Polyangia bacterium]
MQAAWQSAAIGWLALATATASASDGRPSARPDRVLIPAGSFIAGSIHGDEDERPVRRKTLPAFAIDRTEVTRAAYARCVAARRCKPASVSIEAITTDDARLPATGVSWRDAQAYCGFAGGRLPTEAEWEKAARGHDGRDYPWGDGAACDKANWGNFDGEGPCADVNPGHPVAVGQYPTGASPYGVLDLAGNVWEWVADKYDQDPSRRVVRGGSCCSFFVGPRAANRNAWDPNHRDGDLGFRCAGRGR